ISMVFYQNINAPRTGASPDRMAINQPLDKKINVAPNQESTIAETEDDGGEVVREADPEELVDAKDNLVATSPHTHAIIVGAFAIPGNAERMKLQIEALNMEAFLDSTGQLTKVGILSNDDDLETKLQLARKDFSTDAWVKTLSTDR
nr:hypothetical protein [Saprospiraceae bacterium]